MSGRRRIRESERATWAEQSRAYIAEAAANPGRAPEGMGYQPLPTDRFVQMRTVPTLPPNITGPLSRLQVEMLWAAWRGELVRDSRGVWIAGRRASIVTLRALRVRGLVEQGGGLVGITPAGLVALDLLYTDPRDWSTPIEAVMLPTS